MAVKVPSTKTKQWAPDPNITDVELEEMRKEVYDRIIVARVGLLLRHPFFGNMATRLRIVAADDWCVTAAVDGKFMYFNTQFLMHYQIKKLNLLLHTKFYIVCLIIWKDVHGKVENFMLYFLILLKIILLIIC